MDQNKTRKVAIQEIKSLLEAKKPRVIIELTILEKYGLGTTFVNKYLLKLKDIGQLSFGEDNQIIYKE